MKKAAHKIREKWPKQMPLMSHILDQPQRRELEVTSGIIDANPTICEHILQDLNRTKSETQRAGAKGGCQRRTVEKKTGIRF